MNEKDREELYYGQQILCDALLDNVTESLVEAYVEVAETEKTWKVMVAFDRDDAVNQEIFGDIVTEFETFFENSLEYEKLTEVQFFTSEFAVRSEPEPYGEAEARTRVYAFRRMTQYYLDVLKTEHGGAE